MTWTEIDSAVTSPTQTDITFTTMQSRTYTQLDNLPTQHPHYASIPAYINEAKDELLRTLTTLNRAVLDMVPRLRNWRWYDTTVANQNYLPLPERMLWLDEAGYTKLTTAYDVSLTVLYPMNPIPPSSAMDFGTFPRTSTGWPNLFRRAGGRIEFWPTPSSTPTDYRTVIVVMGTRMDKDLSAGGDVLLMPPFMQLLVIDLAVVISMEKMGWEESTEKRGKFSDKLSRQFGAAPKERNAAPIVTRAAGMPR